MILGECVRMDRELKNANKLARDGHFFEALRIYENIVKRNPGFNNVLKFNIERCKRSLIEKNRAEVESNQRLHDMLDYNVSYYKEHYKYTHKPHTLIECHNDKKYISHVINEIEKIASRTDSRVISFDVFDTILLRQSQCESRRIWNASKSFARKHNFNVMDLFIARYDAAKIAYSVSPLLNENREGRFELMANLVCESIGITELVNEYIENEIYCESNQVKISPLYSAIVNHFNEHQIIFVSDMYLEQDKITRLLNFHGIATTNNVFSSADGLGSKRGSARIFKNIESIFSVPSHQIIHMGDSKISDYENSIKNNWNAVFLPVPNYEATLRLSCYEDFCLSLPNNGIDWSSYLNFNM